MRKWKGLIALLAVFGLIAAACGSDDPVSNAVDTATDAAEDAADAATDAAEDAADAAEDAVDDATGGGDAPAEIVTGVGVDGNTIKVGLNADLSGIFAPLVTQIVQGIEIYFEYVNDNGGLTGGYMIEPVVLDSGYDVPTHLENYEEFSGDGSDAVVMFANSTGSPHTAATAEALVEDDLVAIPLSWYSGWVDPAIGENVLEIQTTYCNEAMNGVTYLSENFGTNLAIITFPGEYGQDGAAGAKIAAEALGLNIVYDGEGAVVPGSDQTPVITEIVSSGADIVWAAINPTTLAEIMGGAVAQGFTGMWSGNTPTFNYQLLGTDLAPALDQYYIHSAYTALWNTVDTPGMQLVVNTMREYAPDAPISDSYINGFINGLVTVQILEQAIANGDLTRAGVTAASKQITADLMGLAPDQTWSGDPNSNLVRESYIFDVSADAFTADGTVSDEDAGTGFVLLEGPYASATSTNYVFEEACFSAG